MVKQTPHTGIIDYKTFKYSVLLLIALIIPFNALHEIGHLVPCILSGGNGSFMIGLMASQATCQGALSNSQVFLFMGGLFATLAGILPLTIKTFQRAYLVITLGSLGVGHFIVAILETFATEWYMSSTAMPVITFLSFGLFVGFLIAFGRTEKVRREQYLSAKEAYDLLEKERNVD